MNTKPNSFTNTLLLLLILGLGTVLRFWNFSNMPYLHDELSALGRTTYNSVQDVITYGVEINDTHPPGVQLFLYFWTNLFGTNEMVVKFPFILCGLFSILMAYKISKKWFNITVALVVAAFMATIQYTINYSQLIRPYSSGVFFCLLMVYCWSEFLFEPEHKKKWLTGYILSAVCCAYDHHFALLFAFIVGLSGIPFLTKNSWKPYLLSSLIIFIMYLPNVPILFYQLSKGGLGGPDGWLKTPEPGWLYMYFKYIFHFSYWMYALVAVLLCLSILFCTPEINKTNKFRVLCITWFFSSFFIQYFYSVYISAIIQYSTLLFVFPFLLVFLFSLFRELKEKQNIVIVFSILLIGTTSLAMKRKHFQVFYKQPFQLQLETLFESMDKIKDHSDVTIQLGVPPYLKAIIKKHYSQKYNKNLGDAYFSTMSEYPTPKIFKAFVFSRKTNYFITGGLPMEYIQIIKEKYPYMLVKNEGVISSSYCFSKQKPENEVNNEVMFKQQLVKEKIVLDSTQEFGPAFVFKLKEISYTRFTVINVAATLFPSDTSSNPLLVVSIEENGTALDWAGIAYFKYNTNKDRPNTIFSCNDLISFDFKNHPDAELKIFIWNRDKKKVEIQHMELEVIKGNPFIYGLNEPID
jgi:uncharacterized membrane protein